jgi:hypothetical protein
LEIQRLAKKIIKLPSAETAGIRNNAASLLGIWQHPANIVRYYDTHIGLVAAGGGIFMHKQCHCCNNYTVNSDDEVIVDLCPVCFWQYDAVAHDKPDTMKGANRITLNEARKNFRKYGVCKPEFKRMVREPLFKELPENNR